MGGSEKRIPSQDDILRQTAESIIGCLIKKGKIPATDDRNKAELITSICKDYAKELNSFYHLSMGGDQSAMEHSADTLAFAGIGYVATAYTFLYFTELFAFMSVGKEGTPGAMDAFDKFERQKTVENLNISQAVGSVLGAITALGAQARATYKGKDEAGLIQFRRQFSEKYTLAVGEEAIVRILEGEDGPQLSQKIPVIETAPRAAASLPKNRLINVVPPENLVKRLDRSAGDAIAEEIACGTCYSDHLLKWSNIVPDSLKKPSIAAALMLQWGYGVSYHTMRQGYKNADPISGVETTIAFSAMMSTAYLFASKALDKLDGRSEVAEDVMLPEYLGKYEKYLAALTEKHKAKSGEAYVAYFDIKDSWIEKGFFLTGINPDTGEIWDPTIDEVPEVYREDEKLPISSSMLFANAIQKSIETYKHSWTARVNDCMREPVKGCMEVMDYIKTCCWNDSSKAVAVGLHERLLPE